ncbi:MAG: SDR family oxidoreductase [Gammaproteobacteria bacterium TMED1]|nr:MAG: SDR family oxidoreductase [Gammaproteobacteria bacterium TMED1]|tara:strand:- start:1516 stop:2217 length:702 start_codon:yes stop_codon:yes gene_type:complete
MRTLVITGASKGIGLATASLFCDAGYDVFNFSRTKCPDSRVISYAIDLGDSEAEEHIRESLDETVEEETEVCLVHNAAAMVVDNAREANPDVLSKVLRINVIAPVIFNQHLIKKMKPGSSIIYIGSTLSEKGVPNSFSYVTSKHAVLGLTRSTCQDLVGMEIHTCCVCPGFTDTEMLRAHVSNDKEILSSLSSLSTFGRLIDPKEIADTVLFAAKNPVLNGAIMHANLGQIES